MDSRLDCCNGLNMKRRGSYYSIISIIPLLVLFFVFMLPLSLTLKAAFTNDEGFTFEHLVSVFTSPLNYRILAFTFKQAILSALVSLAIALPGCYLFSNYNFPLKRFLLSLSNLCFTLPSILVVLGFVIFYGNNGTLNKLLMELFSLDEAPLSILYSFKAIILAHAFLNFPIALSVITDKWEHMSATPESAAKTLGSGNAQTFFSITLPRLLPSMLSALLLIFLFCFTSFSIILVLGGGPQFTTLEVEIYRLNNISMNQEAAAALAIFSFIFNFILLLLYVFSERGLSLKEKNRLSRSRKIERNHTRILVFIYSLMLLLFILAPMFSIIYRSFISKGAFSLKAYKELLGILPTKGQLSSALPALINSLTIALTTAFISTLLSLALSLAVARRKKGAGDIIAMLPMAISSVTLGLGYFILKTYLGAHGKGIGFLLVILAHLVIIFPFATRILIPAARSFNERCLLAAYTMGDSEKGASMKIEIPSLLSSIIKSFIFSFALSFGEVNATLTLAEGKITTLPILLYRMINSYNYQGACALGSVLMLTAFLVFFISESLQRAKEN